MDPTLHLESERSQYDTAIANHAKECVDLLKSLHTDLGSHGVHIDSNGFFNVLSAYTSWQNAIVVEPKRSYVVSLFEENFYDTLESCNLPVDTFLDSIDKTRLKARRSPNSRSQLFLWWAAENTPWEADNLNLIEFDFNNSLYAQTQEDTLLNLKRKSHIPLTEFLEQMYGSFIDYETSFRRTIMRHLNDILTEIKPFLVHLTHEKRVEEMNRLLRMAISDSTNFL